MQWPSRPFTRLLWSDAPVPRNTHCGLGVLLTCLPPAHCQGHSGHLSPAFPSSQTMPITDAPFLLAGTGGKDRVHAGLQLSEEWLLAEGDVALPSSQATQRGQSRKVP